MSVSSSKKKPPAGTEPAVRRMPTTQPTPLGRRLREQRELRGWSQEQFADISEISTGMVSQLETGRRGTGIGREIVLRIAKAMSEPEEWWLDIAGLPHTDSTPKQYRPSVSDAIDTDPKLTRVQKRKLKALYDSFVSARPL